MRIRSNHWVILRSNPLLYVHCCKKCVVVQLWHWKISKNEWQIKNYDTWYTEIFLGGNGNSVWKWDGNGNENRYCWNGNGIAPWEWEAMGIWKPFLQTSRHAWVVDHNPEVSYDTTAVIFADLCFSHQNPILCHETSQTSGVLYCFIPYSHSQAVNEMSLMMSSLHRC